MSWSERRARDVMTSPVQTIPRDASLANAMRLFTDEDISGAPVVDHHGLPVGVVSLFDLTVFLSGLERTPGRLGNFYLRSYLRLERADDLEPEGEDLLAETRVDEVMTPEVLSVPPDASLRDVVRLLVERNIHRVLVRDGDGPIEGLISSMDILRTL